MNKKGAGEPGALTDSGFARRTPKGVSSSCPAMGAHGRILGSPKSYHRVCVPFQFGLNLYVNYCVMEELLMNAIGRLFLPSLIDQRGQYLVA